ncbi:(2Fe-2S)-binding protein [Burkholderia cenocepacia]|uniref:(2Fe-2S)-binding protein n=1 Tax=Burkholderia cenocepacia TaxID=95486 RepID=UPI0022381362|nr:(2Fe-2S)-binding protein [Burkholderia cenocepacia]MCW5116754.1 (2Fe-2S)-binding protein [Burkholderia cenocepacia]MCW5129496.1 (2Fe-2S)-binding protein [Burkholderia cenocepacia]MCW5172513.1 (2Fe-2S)-binding protein [Burkholderia cenocepacia]
MRFMLNGQPFDFDGDPDTPLLWVIRDSARLTGTKYGCGIGACGACTVHLDGEAARACVLPAASVAGRAITTIEGLSHHRSHPVQRAWIEKDVPQCGYCQSGMVMATAALLARHRKPTDAQIDAAVTNLCRCATYQRIREAIHVAAG